MKRKEKAYVIAQEQISAGIYSLRLSVSFARDVRAGQFVSLFSADRSRLLPRPISVCEADAAKGRIRLVYRVAGEGTAEFSRLRAGDFVEVMGPLGNGFPLDQAAGRRVLLVGGGIGIPPMLACARGFAALPPEQRPSSAAFVVGYRNADTYLLDDLREAAPVYTATDDGSLGMPGTVLDAIRAEDLEADVVFACGPKPMLRALRDFTDERGMACFVSMEERMACGVGVCLGCVTRTAGVDAHSHVHNARVCTDGPVFDAREVDLT